jgi:hypothetical protein
MKIIIITHKSCHELQKKAQLLLDIVNKDLGSVNPLKNNSLNSFKVRNKLIYIILNLDIFLFHLGICMFK